MDYDLLVIGGGPGGYLASILGAQRKLKTACVERERLGGVCLNVGCIPSKALLRAAENWRFIQDEAGKFGFAIQGATFDYAKVVARSRKIADQSERGVRFLFKKHGVEHLSGEATIVGPGRVRVGERELTAKHVILATGARARTFPGIEPDGERILTYREAITGTTQPASVVILGSGAIGAEFAYFFNAFGTKVTLVEGMERIVPLEDDEISAELGKAFRKQGIELVTGAFCERVERSGTGVVARLRDGRALEASHCLLALGVTANVQGIGLETVGIALEKGAIAVDASYRTNIPGFYAIGDVAGPPALAHAAYAEAQVCVGRIAGEHVPDVNYDNMPAATYCQPQVASVGLTEAEAKRRGLPFTVGRFPFSANGKARAIGASDGLVKVLVDTRHGLILGAHLCGHDASELLANFVMARGAEVTAPHFEHTVHAHPTLGEAMLEAIAEARGRGTHL
jgi:dihydrolipoamide dehydrogenase